MRYMLLFFYFLHCTIISMENGNARLEPSLSSEDIHKIPRKIKRSSGSASQLMDTDAAKQMSKEDDVSFSDVYDIEDLNKVPQSPTLSPKQIAMIIPDVGKRKGSPPTQNRKNKYSRQEIREKIAEAKKAHELLKKRKEEEKRKSNA